jgi:hypothetical protein
MAVRKYIREVYNSSTGHKYELVAVTGAQIGTGKLLNQINPTLHRFKDHKAVEEGKAPCSDRIQPVQLLKGDMEIGLSPLEIINAITQAIADKAGYEIVEFEEEINEKSLEAYRLELKQAEQSVEEPIEEPVKEPIEPTPGV